MTMQDEGVPTIELREFDESCLRLLRNLQGVLLKHPVAFQAAFSALVSEGEKFAQTPEGHEIRNRLERSPIVHQLQYAFDISTLSLLERDSPSILPSAYIDVLFMLANSEDADRVLDQLFAEASL